MGAQMNLPNQLTVSRLVLTVFFVAVTAVPWSYAFTAGLVLFGVASLTDWLDGKIARERNLVTAFGQLMDPLADKVLMAAAFVTLSDQRLMPGWLVIAIILVAVFLSSFFAMVFIMSRRAKSDPSRTGTRPDHH